MEQWTLWTDGQLDSPAWPQWKCIGSAVICKSRSFASQVENWVNAMLGGIGLRPSWRPKSSSPNPRQITWKPVRGVVRDGLRGVMAIRMAMSLQWAFVLQPVQNTKYKRQQNSKRHTRAQIQKSGQTWRTKFQPYMLYTLRKIPLLDCDAHWLTVASFYT